MFNKYLLFNATIYLFNKSQLAKLLVAIYDMKLEFKCFYVSYLQLINNKIINFSLFKNQVNQMFEPIVENS